MQKESCLVAFQISIQFAIRLFYLVHYLFFYCARYFVHYYDADVTSEYRFCHGPTNADRSKDVFFSELFQLLRAAAKKNKHFEKISNDDFSVVEQPVTLLRSSILILAKNLATPITENYSNCARTTNEIRKTATVHPYVRTLYISLCII